MSGKMCSYYAIAGDLKKLLDNLTLLRNSGYGKDILSLEQFLRTSVFYIGVPHETYPTRVEGVLLDLKDIPDSVPARIETKTGELEEAIKMVRSAAASKDVEDRLRLRGSFAEVVSILEKILNERYYDKTHQVPSFDSMAHRLTYE